MNKPPKIDITKSVMSQIDAGQVKMKPKAYFTAKKLIKFAGLAMIAMALFVAIFYAVVIIQNGVFKEYLEFGKQGVNIFWNSLPWGAIIISVLLMVAMGLGIYLVQQKKRLIPSIIGVVVAVSLVTALVFRISPDPSSNALARAVVGADGNPTRIAGTVEEKNGSKLKIKTSTGEVYVVDISNSTLGDRSFENGDEVLVLGNKQNGSVNADAIKTTKKTEKKVAEVKQEQPINTEPETKPVEEPNPGQKPAAVAPVVSRPTAPSTPSVPVNSIVITSAVGPVSSPRKFKVTFTTNFASPLGYKMVWSLHPSVPVYPGSNNTYLSGAITPGSYVGIVTEDFGPGTYNVRVCEKTLSGCNLYSNQITVLFP